MIVLDTSVVSLLFRGDSRSGYYLARIADERAVIAFQTVEETWYGAYKAGWGQRRTDELARHLAQYEVVWPDAETVDLSANLPSAWPTGSRSPTIWTATACTGRMCRISPASGC